MKLAFASGFRRFHPAKIGAVRASIKIFPQSVCIGLLSVRRKKVSVYPQFLASTAVVGTDTNPMHADMGSSMQSAVTSPMLELLYNNVFIF
ncbi:hypothetical protein [Parapedobacter tibetensis]|uniref:hypothetical protein n=1 Tax=Parapedobacter tibetensis TaxID=2972951 RepID=UPI00214DEA80|nr:hypothetical protein [Parapedobacter tibetensis]